jgi:tRNA(fMet)-specific endonuclease VapC
VQRNLREVQGFAAIAQVLPCDQLTAEIYGQVKSELKAKGNPIPENDLWIAAIARQYSLTLHPRPALSEYRWAIDRKVVSC